MHVPLFDYAWRLKSPTLDQTTTNQKKVLKVHKFMCSRELELEIGKEGNPFEDWINKLFPLIF